MEVTSTEFIGSYTSLKTMPRQGLPEVAFVGRSNVGKSSLINRLLRVKRLALTSSTPGKTRKINLFRISDKLFFVDLPGYGFARVSKTERGSWQGMIEGYLLGSEQLRLLILLIDARHGPQANDRQMVEWLEHEQLPFQIVLTKADKLKRNDLAALSRAVRTPGHEMHGALVCSAANGLGTKEIWSAIDASVRQ